MKKILVIFIALFILLNPVNVLAIYDPLSVPNNKIGIHILFPEEVSKAKELVNNQGKGEWGYVTIPIQSSDRNRPKWQKFFDDCKENKIIPIVRVATVATGSNWDKPDNFDLLDFANFLSELKWPISNRYIIIFNEVNRADEYGGFVNPEDYADILSNAIDIFKSRSTDFFILPAGLDNAAINTGKSLSWRTYLERMHRHNPEVFSKIDGWTSHAYPNPDFSSRPDKSGTNKIDSYNTDLKLLSRFTSKKLPIFITEAGWSNKHLSNNQIGYFYDYAMKNVWKNSQIVAVTPFLMNAQDGAFTDFSFLNEDGSFKEYADNFSRYATKGDPIIASIPAEVMANTSDTNIVAQPTGGNQSLTILQNLYQNILKLLNPLGR